MRQVLLAGALTTLVLAGCADHPAAPATDAARASGARRSTSAATPGLLWQNLATGERRTWQMAGATWTGAETALPLVEPAWSIGAAADFNRDGHPDIVWQKRTTGERTIWFMNGAAWTGTQQFLPVVPTEWDIAAAADFDADGSPDLVWQNRATGERMIWLMSGTTHTGTQLLPVVEVEWDLAAAADFNADGRPDLAWQKRTTGERVIWFMNGPTPSGNQTFLPLVEVEWDLAAAADFNADGSPDLVWQKRTTGERTIWFMSGATWTGTQQFLPVVDPAWEIAAAFPPPAAAPTGKTFYAWTSRYTGQPGGIRLQADEKVAMHESFDRQFVWAGNCEKRLIVDSAFVFRNRGRRLLYIVGDEPDHNQSAVCPGGATPYYTPAEYAQIFHDAVELISRFDSTARFSNGGFTHPGATPPGTPHFTAYADAFIAAYRNVPGTGGQEPPVAEWRFNLNGLDAATFASRVVDTAEWGRTRGGKQVFIGSFDGDQMEARINAIRSRPEIVGAAWWNYDHTWPWALSNADGSLNDRGREYLRLTS